VGKRRGGLPSVKLMASCAMGNSHGKELIKPLLGLYQVRIVMRSFDEAAAEDHARMYIPILQSEKGFDNKLMTTVLAIVSCRKPGCSGKVESSLIRKATLAIKLY
jgi:hypothetical protein